MEDLLNAINKSTGDDFVSTYNLLTETSVRKIRKKNKGEKKKKNDDSNDDDESSTLPFPKMEDAKIADIKSKLSQMDKVVLSGDVKNTVRGRYLF